MAKPGKNKISVREVYKYLMTFPGMTNDKAVGILANIQAESAFYIDAVEMGDVKNKGLGLDVCNAFNLISGFPVVHPTLTYSVVICPHLFSIASPIK